MLTTLSYINIMGCVSALSSVEMEESTLNKSKAKTGLAIPEDKVINWLIWAILCADLGKAPGSGCKLISRQLSIAFLTMKDGDIYLTNRGRRRSVPKRVRVVLDGIVFSDCGSFPTSYAVEKESSDMMRAFCDVFYLSMQPGGYIEVRDQEKANRFFKSYMEGAISKYSITSRDISCLLRMGQAMADCLIDIVVCKNR